MEEDKKDKYADIKIKLNDVYTLVFYNGLEEIETIKFKDIKDIAKHLEQTTHETYRATYKNAIHKKTNRIYRIFKSDDKFIIQKGDKEPVALPTIKAVCEALEAPYYKVLLILNSQK